MSESERARRGWVYLVGAGPGDSGLLTRRAAALIDTADLVLVHPRVHPTIATRPDAQALPAAPMALSPDASVVLLVHGDALPQLDPWRVSLAAAGHPFEVVAGVSLAAAAAAFAGLAGSPVEMAALQTETWSEATDRWRRAGHQDDAAVATVVDPGLPTQRTNTQRLGDPAPSRADVAAVGDAAAGREARRWFDRLPLFGRRVVVTRPAHQIAATASRLRRRGAEPLPFPTIALQAPPDPARVERTVSRMGDYDLVVFTSPNGVDWFWSAIDAAGLDARAFGSAEVAAIGPATAANLQRHGVRPDVVAPKFVAEELAGAILEARGERRGRVLLPRALVAREILPQTLREAGFEVDVVPVYETVSAPPERGDALKATLSAGVDAILFTSSSTVDNLVFMLGDDAVALTRACTVASIGPITTATAEGHGLTVEVTAEVSTGPGLVDALEAFFSEA